MRKIFLFLAILLFLSFSQLAIAQALIIDHNAVQKFNEIPAEWIEKAKQEFRISYGHTSHGSQIITGVSLLKNSTYDYEDNYPNKTSTAGKLSFWDNRISGASDLGNPNFTAWATATRNHLNGAGSDRNIIIWSWCSQADTTAQNIELYLSQMNQLEQEFLNVKFVYMTGHLNGTGPTGNLYQRNNQIREYCKNNGKILFDFADIESYDPAGNYYPNENDACNWGTAWCTTNSCPSCGCAHSQCINCYNKGKAFWYMMARLAGWDSESQACNLDIDCLSGELCCSGFCKKPVCDSNVNCSTGQQCINPGECNSSCQNINCAQGAITIACYCGGLPRTTGYCCNGAYQTVPCGQCTSDTQCSASQKCCSGTCKAPTCMQDANCNDNNAATKDNCNNPNTCTAACTNTPITQCINNDNYCPAGCTSATDNDCLASCGNNIIDTNENCTNCPQDVKCVINQTCCNNTCIALECISDSNCQTNQKCINPGTCTAQCIDCNISCTTDTACNDNNSTTIDKCNEAGSCDSYCTNEPPTCGGNICTTGQTCCNNQCIQPACKKSSECNDQNKCTTDTCKQAGTCNAACTHTIIPKCGWKKMNWTLPSCFPIGNSFDITIKDENNNAIENAEITYGTNKTLTDTKGKATLTGEKSQYNISAKKDGYYSLTGKKIATTTCNPTYATNGTKPTTSKEKINIQILETPYIGKQFTIKITDNNSNPIQGATVTYGTQNTTTNTTGTTTLTGQKSAYLITATATQGKATTKILPRVQANDQNRDNNGNNNQLNNFQIPYDIIALAAIILIGIVLVARSRMQKK